MTRLVRTPVALLAALLTFWPLAAWADGASRPPSCEEIAEKARTHSVLDFDAGRAVVELVVRPAKGAPRRRTLEVRSTREEGLRRALVRFLEPADVAGTALLMREKEDGTDEQILYLPALKRTRRIAGGQRSGSFMGTDFSYADLQVQSLEGSVCQLEGEETLEGQPTWVLTVRPGRDETDAPYAGAKLWIHAKTWVPLKVEFFDEAGGAPVKVMTVRRLKKVEGRWLPVETVMRNVRKGSSTRLKVVKVEPHASFPPDSFTERALTR